MMKKFLSAMLMLFFGGLSSGAYADATEEVIRQLNERNDAISLERVDWPLVHGVRFKSIYRVVRKDQPSVPLFQFPSGLHYLEFSLSERRLGSGITELLGDLCRAVKVAQGNQRLYGWADFIRDSGSLEKYNLEDGGEGLYSAMKENLADSLIIIGELSSQLSGIGQEVETLIIGYADATKPNEKAQFQLRADERVIPYLRKRDQFNFDSSPSIWIVEDPIENVDFANLRADYVRRELIKPYFETCDFASTPRYFVLEGADGPNGTDPGFRTVDLYLYIH